jgi:hypothetical protein
VKRIKAFWAALKRLAGVTGRHNRALRELNDWAGAVNKFLKTYGLEADAGIDILLENSGDAKFDLTVIATKGRTMMATAGKIRKKRLPSMVAGIVDSVESIRRYLINPALQKERLRRGIINLRSSTEELQKTLEEIDYL